MAEHTTPIRRQMKHAAIYAGAVIVVSIAVAVIGTALTEHSTAVMVAFPLVALFGALGAAVNTYLVHRQGKPYMPWFASVWVLMVYFLLALGNSGPYLTGIAE